MGRERDNLAHYLEEVSREGAKGAKGEDRGVEMGRGWRSGDAGERGTGTMRVCAPAAVGERKGRTQGKGRLASGGGPVHCAALHSG